MERVGPAIAVMNRWVRLASPCSCPRTRTSTIPEAAGTAIGLTGGKKIGATCFEELCRGRQNALHQQFAPLRDGAGTLAQVRQMRIRRCCEDYARREHRAQQEVRLHRNGDRA